MAAHPHEPSERRLTLVAAVQPGDLCYEPVLRTAGRLAKGGSCTVLSVFPGPIEWVYDPSRTAESETADAREAVSRQIEADAIRIGMTDTDVFVPVAKEPNVGDDVVAHCRRLGADVIVLGTHGRTGLQAWVLGSVAERVVRHAHCDVYVVRAPEPAAPTAPSITKA